MLNQLIQPDNENNQTTKLKEEEKTGKEKEKKEQTNEINNECNWGILYIFNCCTICCID